MYPKLTPLQTSRQIVDAFGGYNHNLRIGDGEFFEMENMTSDYYPILSPRRERGVYQIPEAPQGLIAKDALCYVDGRNFVMGGYRIDMGLTIDETPKQLISMGAYVIILPDKKYINTADITDFGDMEAEVTTRADVTFTLSKADGSEYNAQYSQTDAPATPENMTLWVDTSTTPHTLKQWSESAGTWNSIATTYIKIASAGIGKAFSQYDGIEISGLKDVDLIDSTTDSKIEDPSELAALEGAAIVWDKGDNYIVIAGMLKITRTITNQITISRKMPDMDFVVESKNRLWGCRYGLDSNGAVVNQIYASKLGDFKNWNCFMGIATDSWFGSVGTDGQFTGAITHLGYPLFFKENVLHKVYISETGAHGIQDTACRGVQKGCERSLAIVDEILYYKARHAVCAYDGSLPAEVSYNLGEIRYGNAVAGAHGSKYYISMVDMYAKSHLFVYDAVKRLWHREDGFRADCFCSCEDELYAICHDTKRIVTMLGSGTADGEKVGWMVQTGPLTMVMPDMKYISRVTVRMALELGSRVRFSAQYDSVGGWENLGNISGTSMRSFSIPIRPRRCDHFRLRIEGIGGAKIYSITQTIEQGSDIS